MTLLGLLFSGRKAAFVAVVVFSVLSALLSVAVLAFIGQRMLSAQADLGLVLLQFSGLLAALLAAATIAQVTLHKLDENTSLRITNSSTERFWVSPVLSRLPLRLKWIKSFPR